MTDDDPQSNRPRRPGFGFAELPDRLLEILRASPAGEIEQHLRAGLQQGIERLDLVTREEFEIQREMVERLRARIEALEARVAELESQERDTP
ncbi:MAG: accessory factor UbiK family protein [Burkholderiaceae bacterium]